MFAYLCIALMYVKIPLIDIFRLLYRNYMYIPLYICIYDYIL